MNIRGKRLLFVLCAAMALSGAALALERTPPHAADQTITTYQNLTTSGDFAVTEVGDYTCQILTRPAHGIVTVTDAGFCYTPYQTFVGEDRFTYLAKDADGIWSEEATVTVEVLEQESAMYYADLAGHPAEYAAVRLAEEGIFAGAVYGGRQYFLADAPVTRAEFLAMTLAAAGIPPVAAAAELVDEGDMPAWAGGYVTAAIQEGILIGRSQNGETLYETTAPITWAEAAVMLANALELPAVGESAAAPVWAATAWQAALDAGYPLRRQNPADVLTRSDAARLLCALLPDEEPTAPTGLFSWTTVS